MKVTLFVALILIASISVAGQSQDAASTLQRFEASWLQSILNQDDHWLSRLSNGKLDIRAAANTDWEELS